MLKGVLFDADGVLVDSERVYFEIIQETFRPYGVPIGEEDYVKRWIIESTTTPGVIRDYGLTQSVEEIRRRQNQIFERRLKDIKIMPYALELLESLHGEIPLGVVSSEVRYKLGRKLGKFDLLRFFNARVCAEDVTYKKPNPEPYERGARLLNVNPRNIVVIEDNPSGVSSARDAGCKVIAFPNGFTEGFDFSHAHEAVSSLKEINMGMLENLSA
jgi:HAD superfamily hydrolase (TIGR01509 family)